MANEYERGYGDALTDVIEAHRRGGVAGLAEWIENNCHERDRVDAHNLRLAVTPESHEGHESHALCVHQHHKQPRQIHEYPTGWAHTEDVKCSDPRPAPGTKACSCEWTLAMARRAGYV